MKIRMTLKQGYVFSALATIILVVILIGCGQSPPQKQVTGDPVPQIDIEDTDKIVSKKVFVVHSYHPEYEWVASIDRGIKSNFVARSDDLQFFYMDTLRQPSDASKKEKGAEALQAVKEWNPDLVIAVDDNAQAYFGKYLVGPENPILVFCGVNKAPKTYGYPATNVTGIHEIIPFNETMILARQLFPDLENTMILSEDSTTSDAAIEYIQEVNDTIKIAEIRKPETYAQWQESIYWANDNVQSIVIYRYHSFQDEQGNRIKSHDVIDWTMNASRLPIFSSLSFAIDDGVLGGVVESGIQQGQDASKMAIALLDGDSIENHPVRTASEYHSKINLTTARSMNLKISNELLSTIDVLVGDQNL